MVNHDPNISESENLVGKMFAAEDSETEPYSVTVLNSEYIVLPGVFSPKIRRNSSWFTEKIPAFLSGARFLEIGSGAGVLSVHVARLGYKVVATDINPIAVKNTKLNAEKYGMEVDVRQGNLFAPLKVDELFDVIFWNHPWLYTEREVNLRHQASYDQYYRSLETFLTEAKGHLSPSGYILLGTGSLARLDLIEQLGTREGYSIEVLLKEKQPLQAGENELVEFMIYKLSRIESITQN